MKQELNPLEAFKKAVEIAGSQSALARLCGVGQPAVWKWLQSAKRLPAEYVLQVEAATGVSRHLLRPDIYPREIDLALPSSAIGEPHLECGPAISARALARHGNNNDFLPGKGAA
ncbi:MAG: helix-turn-helix domain-containing protein [Sphingobium sp.]|nr:helix-turn-helix domain-containing protein [Sphingobium sp.]